MLWFSKQQDALRARDRAANEIAEKSAVVQRAYDAFRGKQPKAIVLTLASDTWPKSVKELSPTQKKQLVATGQPYDGETTSAEKRFATFEGSLRIRTVASAKGKPAYDVFTYLADDGCVFLAETTELVAWFVQDSLDTQGDVALHEALQSALAGRPKKAKAAKPKKKI